MREKERGRKEGRVQKDGVHYKTNPGACGELENITLFRLSYRRQQAKVVQSVGVLASPGFRLSNIICVPEALSHHAQQTTTG